MRGLLSGGLGCDGGSRQGGNGGENCQQFLKEAAGGAAQQQGCAKNNTDFSSQWRLWSVVGNGNIC